MSRIYWPQRARKEKKEDSISLFSALLLGAVFGLFWSASDLRKELDQSKEEIKQLKQAQMQSKVDGCRATPTHEG